MAIIRISDETQITDKMVEKIINEGNEIIIQFSKEIYNKEILRNIDSIIRKYDTKIEIRFYGHYKKSFNLKYLKYIPNVKKLSIDCMENIEELKKMGKLIKLNFGNIQNLKQDILEYENIRSINELLLYNGEINNNLSLLKYFKELNSLTLYCAKLEDYTFLNKISNLKKLKILLGTCGKNGNWDKLEIPIIEELSLCKVRGLKEFGDISRFKNLKKIIIEEQIKIEKIEFSSEHLNLKRIMLSNCKNLKILNGLDKLKNLSELRILKTLLSFEEIINVKFADTLESLWFTNGKKKDEDIYARKIGELGYNILIKEKW